MALHKRALASSSAIVLAIGSILAITACHQKSNSHSQAPSPGDANSTKAAAGQVSGAEGLIGSSSAASSGPQAQAGQGLSLHPKVRYKKIRMIRQDFSQALQLDSAKLCEEGGHDCLDNYKVILGSINIEQSSYVAVEPPTPASAIAVERVAMQACSVRVEQDLSGTPVIFAGLKASASNYTPEMAEATKKLYLGFSQRQPSSYEAEAMKQLFAKVLASSGEASAGEKWGVLACWAIATSLESVLY